MCSVSVVDGNGRSIYMQVCSGCYMPTSSERSRAGYHEFVIVGRGEEFTYHYIDYRCRCCNATVRYLTAPVQR